MSLRKYIRGILHSTVEGAGQWVLFTALVVSENELRAGILGIWHSTWERRKVVEFTVLTVR